MIHDNYYLWIEIEANRHRIPDEAYFSRVLDNCGNAGIGSVILAVKDTTGFGIYKSDIVPHYSKYDTCFQDTDYLKKYIGLARQKGLKLYAAVDVFAEGRVKAYSPLSPGFKNPEWQTRMYGIDESGNPVIRPVADLSNIKTTGSIDDFSEVFVNPVREDVRDYELGIIKELADKYDMDGIVLDRVRFLGLGSDFSDYTRNRFEEYTGGRVRNWPEDIFKLRISDGNVDVAYGPLFGKWITFRAAIIKKFIVEVNRIVGNSGRKLELLDYTGSWYPLYYLVGANWASSQYVPDEYPWVQSEYADTGYAEYIDGLLSGFYYEDVTINDAMAHGKPAYWYSVEGSGDMVEKVVKKAVPYIGSLYLKQYEGNPEAFKNAVDMCFKKSQGCMLFDLCYIDDYGWWQLCSRD